MIARMGKSSRDASACVLLSLLLLPSSIVGRSGEQRQFGGTATAAQDLEGRAEATTREETRSRDSYLEALNHSRTSTDPREGVVAVDVPRGPVYATKRAEVLPGRDSYSPPSRTPERFHGVRDSYGPAYDDYSPHGEYATPGPYSTPQHQGYGPPVAAYGLAHATPQSVHLGIPSVDFSWPFALKLNAFTLAKIILKLVIFKMIVKFIAVVCLLLFIPKLEMKKGKKGSSESGDGDDDDERSRSTNAESMAWNRLNRLTFLVDDALGRYRNASESRPGSGDQCQTPECRDPGTLDYENLLRGYLLEETRLLRGKS